MKNTYMTPLQYENFNGAKKTVKLFFHLTPREFADWMISNGEEADKFERDFTEMQEQMQDDPDGEPSTEQKRTMLRLVKVIAELSQGIPSDDGEFFDKTSNKKFIYSAAYDAFRLFLFEHPKELEEFIKSLLNEDVISEFSGRLESSAKNELEAGPNGSNGNGDKNMSNDELIARIKELESQKAASAPVAPPVEAQQS